jgi:hypothetical protein
MGRKKTSWENNIKLPLKEIVCEGVDWIHLAQSRDHWVDWIHPAQSRDHWRVLADTVTNLWIPSTEESLLVEQVLTNTVEFLQLERL